MTVIAMTREMGTLGKDVALGIADSLDLSVVHSELVEHDLASRLGVQDSAVHHYLEGNASLLERWKIDKQKLSQYTAEEILELAQAGDVVIRGWGAVAVLRSVPHVLRVRVCAPMAYREQVIMKRMAITDAAVARSEIERNDAAHARVMRGFFGVNWENPQLYHVVLNTGSVPIETCVRIVRLLTDEPRFQANSESSTILADKLVEMRVRNALEVAGFDTSSGIEIAVASGTVTLSGVIAEGRDISGAIDNVRQIEGVKDVENKIEHAVFNVRYGV